MGELEKSGEWSGYSNEEKDIVLKILTKVELRMTIKNVGIADDKIDKAVDNAIDILIKK